MKKMRRELNMAKSLVMQQQFRSRQQKPLKGKGSYTRKASRIIKDTEAFLVA